MLFLLEEANEPAVIASVKDLAVILYKLLFLDWIIVAGQGDIGSLPNERRLIEYVLPARVDELVESITSSTEYSNGTNDARITTDNAENFLAFALQWMCDIDMNDLVIFLTDNEDSRFVAIRVNSSLEAAFTTWRQRLKQHATRIERRFLGRRHSRPRQSDDRRTRPHP